MSNTWFVSDTHFNHESIMKWYPERGAFRSVKEMREKMIGNWNSVIRPGDTVYHIGDFDVQRGDAYDPVNVVRRLNGNIILIAGNHDKKLLRNNKEFYNAFYQVHPDGYHEARVMGEHIVLCHFPIWEWHQIHRGAWHLHGHLHGKPHGIPGKILDVGVDNHNLMPWSFEEVKAHMDALPARQHH